MLRSQLFLATVAAVGVLAVGEFGCGDSTGVGGGGATPGGVQPPTRPDGGGKGDGSGTVFGTTHIFIGTKTRAGVESADAWKDYGYDLDGQITGNDFSKHCTPNGGGAPQNVFPDGNNGIDNSFGRTLLPVIKTAAMTATSDLEAQLNMAITDGSFNIMINLTDLGTSTNYDPISALLLAGKEGNGTAWKAAPEFLDNPTDPLSAKVKFPNSYLTNNTWVSGDKGTVDLSIAIAGFALDLKIQSAVITMDLDDSHGSSTNGIIAGVLNTEDLITEIQKVIGNVDVSFCEGSAVDGILNVIRQASDIMADGTQDPNSMCNGISIGLGFDASAVTIDGVGATSPPGSNLCLCGNGMIDPGEDCDDSNTMKGDGCDDKCKDEVGAGGGGTGGAGGG